MLVSRKVHGAKNKRHREKKVSGFRVQRRSEIRDRRSEISKNQRSVRDRAHRAKEGFRIQESVQERKEV